MKKLAWLVLGMISFGFTGKGAEVVPYYQLENDSIKLFLGISNTKSKRVTLAFDKENVVSFSVECKQGESIRFFHTDAKPDCARFRGQDSILMRRLNAQAQQRFEDYCSDQKKWSEVLFQGEKKVIYLRTLPANWKNCEILKVDLELEKRKYTVK